MFDSMTESEFLNLPERFRNKKAAALLRSYHEKKTPSLLNTYRRIERWLRLVALDPDNFPQLSDRYHYHLVKAEVGWKEHNLLSNFQVKDRPSDAPFLSAHVYLDNLRSAHNVGSILRTTEAFRLGDVYFGKSTPFIDNAKVQNTSMESYNKVNCKKITALEELPRPLIALETDPLAPSVFDFQFPSHFTLLLGNEEYGLSRETLSQTDEIVCIPLCGFKNSLNVASALRLQLERLAIN